MCLLVFAYRTHPRYPFIFAGNRDEFHGRPTAPAGYWADHPEILAGRDLKAGGTWLGVSRSGRFATVTNFREPNEQIADARSRGELVTNFLLDEGSPRDFRQAAAASGQLYNGFNLIFGHCSELHYVTNRDGVADYEISPGLYGLSNGRLDTSWPKVVRAKELFQKVVQRDHVDSEDLLALLTDEWRPSDEHLPRTGIDLSWERRVSSIFIRGDEYGTRASTAVLISGTGEVTLVERSFGPGGVEIGTQRFEFVAESAPVR